MTIPRRRIVALVAAMALAAGACASDGSDDTAAAADIADLPADPAPDTAGGSDGEGDATGESDDGDDGDGSGEVPTEADFEEAELAFQQCMDDAGFDIGFGGGGESIDGSGDGGDGDSVAAFSIDDAAAQGDFEAAIEECNKAFDGLIDDYQPSPEEQAELADQQAAFANCLSEYGIEFNDEGNGSFSIGTESGSYTELAEQEEAMERCSGEAFGQSIFAGPGTDEEEG